MNKWDNLENIERKEVNRLQTRTELYQAGKKNKSGLAYNIMNLDYDKSKDGNKLREIDGDAKVRALMRSKNLEQKNNGAYNIITGD